eukprot:gene26611-biopygen58391
MGPSHDGMMGRFREDGWVTGWGDAPEAAAAPRAPSGQPRWKRHRVGEEGPGRAERRRGRYRLSACGDPGGDPAGGEVKVKVQLLPVGCPADGMDPGAGVQPEGAPPPGADVVSPPLLSPPPPGAAGRTTVVDMMADGTRSVQHLRRVDPQAATPSPSHRRRVKVGLKRERASTGDSPDGVTGDSASARGRSAGRTQAWRSSSGHAGRAAGSGHRQM